MSVGSLFLERKDVAVADSGNSLGLFSSVCFRFSFVCLFTLCVLFIFVGKCFINEVLLIVLLGYISLCRLSANGSMLVSKIASDQNPFLLVQSQLLSIYTLFI